MNPPSGLEPTPAHGYPILVCPHCGRELPPLAKPAARHAAQVRTESARLNRAPELEDATPTMPHRASAQLAETERMEPRDQ